MQQSTPYSILGHDNDIVSVLGSIIRVNEQEYKTKKIFYLILIAMVLFSHLAGYARNTVLKISIEEALELGERKFRLNSSIRLYSGDQAYPAIERQLGTYTANRKTSDVGKSDQRACKWAFLTAIMTLQNRVVREGVNAVVNIRSYYDKRNLSSTTEFECGAGALMAGVTIVGDVVKLAQ